MFNEEQQKAIETIKGQLILVACPGSGKTTTLLGRIHEMIQQGVPAENILMVTFTTAAAGEMKQRFWKKYAEDGMVTFCTIHSFCLATLKKFAHFDAECVLATGDIYEFFFQQLVRHKEIVDKVEYIKALLLDIAVCKNSMCPLAQFEPNCGEKELFDELFKAYENWKDALGKIDYDDMLLKAYELMKNDKTCLEWLQERYQYIQIDEFQDTNYLQRDILYLLAGENGNIAVVGDDDQSIYGFRGAKPEIMLKFAEHYPNAVSLHLSTNYRSDRKIIECASNLIHHNKERFDKEFLASHEEEGIVHHQTYNDIDAEQRGLVKMILEKKMSMEEYRNTSILYRTNKEAVQVSDLLITEKIPFWCTEPIQDKYDHWIYRDILSYHKLGNGIGNKMDLNRILNHPQRFLFDSRFFKTDGSLKQLMHVAATLPDGKWKRSKAMDSVEDMFYLFKKLEDKNPVDTLKILDSFGRYKIFLHDYAEYRNMSPGELYFYWNSYKADAEKHNDWKEWDAYVRKHKIILQEQLRKHDGIALSTLHRSKGLEWDRVYILNCVKNTIPFAKQGTVEDLEEERRLFYVGCTRAKKELQLLSYQGNSGEISPFIKELKSSESDTGDKVDLDVHLKY